MRVEMNCPTEELGVVKEIREKRNMQKGYMSLHGTTPTSPIAISVLHNELSVFKSSSDLKKANCMSCDHNTIIVSKWEQKENSEYTAQTEGNILWYTVYMEVEIYSTSMTVYNKIESLWRKVSCSFFPTSTGYD